MKGITQLALFILTLFVFHTHELNAQAPSSFNYQGLARNDAGEPLENKQISLKISILKSSDQGQVVFSESHSVNTNDRGMFSIRIGEGSSITGSVDSIPWGDDTYFVKSEMDPNGGTNYIEMGASQVYSVPYALYAQSAGNSNGQGDPLWMNSGSDIYFNSGKVGINRLPVDHEFELEGSMGVYDAEGSDRARLSIGTQGSGLISTKGPNGQENLFLGRRDNDPNLGWMSILDAEGDDMVGLSITDVGNGFMFTAGPNGEDNFFVGSRDSNPNLGWMSVLDAEGDDKVGLSLFDDGSGFMFTAGPNGKDNFFVGSRDSNPNLGWMGIFNEKGESIVRQTIDEDGNGIISVDGANGNRNFYIGAKAEDPNVGWIGVADGRGEYVATMSVDEDSGDGNGRIITYGPNGERNTALAARSSDPNKGWIGVYDGNGNTRASMRVGTDANGIFSADGPNGNLNFRVGTRDNDDNKGWAGVMDGSGNAKAAMTIDNNGNGLIFADVKNFRISHPIQAGKEIWYASLEGPEVAVYARGTSQLSGGIDTLYLPDHFSSIIADNTLTTILTPRYWDTYGLAVIQQTREYIIVRDLKGGTGNFQYDWEVKAVRKKHIDYRVVRDKSEMYHVQEVDNKRKDQTDIKGNSLKEEDRSPRGKANFKMKNQKSTPRGKSNIRN